MEGHSEDEQKSVFCHGEKLDNQKNQKKWNRSENEAVQARI